MNLHRVSRRLGPEKRAVPFCLRKKSTGPEKVAIIGAGPAGLTCAYFLAIEGYPVTVFEKLPVLGGMLTVGIPAYRLPRNIIEAEIQTIRDLGVEFKTGVEIGKDFTIGQLRDRGIRPSFWGSGPRPARPWASKGKTWRGSIRVSTFCGK